MKPSKDNEWGFDYIITKRSVASVSSDVGFTALAYNLRRIYEYPQSIKEQQQAVFESL